MHPAFGPVAAALDAIVRRRPGGGAVCVYHRGQCVVDVWAGVVDHEGHPWERETLCTSFSTGKGVASTLLHMLADRGLVDHDEPIASYWPEFAASGKARVTVRQLMSHESALHTIRGVVPDAFAFTDWDAMCATLAAQPPAWEPGTRNGYHGITYGWLVGGLIERVSGTPFAELLDREIVRPLGLDGAYFGVPAAERHRLAKLMTRGRTRNEERPKALMVMEQLARFERARPAIDAFYVARWQELLDSDDLQSAPMPAFNGAFTARSLARMYAALAGGGTLGDVTLMAPETVRNAAVVQNTRADAVVWFPMHWRLGYHLAATTSGVLPHGFGHFGYGGSGAWCDIDSGVAMAFTTNTLAGTPFGDTRMLRLGASARQCARRVS